MRGGAQLGLAPLLPTVAARRFPYVGEHRCDAYARCQKGLLVIEDDGDSAKLGRRKSLSLSQRPLEVSLDPSPSWLGVRPSIRLRRQALRPPCNRACPRRS